MYLDRVHLYLKAGEGGNGLVSLQSRKYVEFGGPDGGDGGKGGDVLFKVNPRLNSLYKLKFEPHISAEDGQKGGPKNMHGRNGDDVTIEVPPGTVIFDTATDEQLIDMTNPEEEFVILKGGRGGFGNAHFTSSTRQTPRFGEIGDVGEKMDVRLELKTVADVGIIGFPNVGKSTLISTVSNAKPKIADYEFTTLTPNLGVVHTGGEAMLLCDIPGLIEGASDGKGLGHHFLRHIERCSTLIHVIDINADDVVEKYNVIRTELEKHSEILAQKPEIVAFSKIDTVDTDSVKMIVDHFKKETGVKVLFPISSATHAGVEELMYATLDQVKAFRESKMEEVTEDTYKVFRPHLENADTFSVAWNEEENFWEVKGARIEQIGRMTMWGNREAEARIYDILERKGILKDMKKQGAEFGQMIKVGFGKIKFMDFED